MAVVRVAGFIVLLAFVAEAGKDIGLEGLFTTTKNVTRQCHAATLPSDIDGSFVIAGPGVFEMGKYKFASHSDAFAQFYKFEIGHEQICFSSQTMLTKFWNQSVQKDQVAPSMLFADTDPPRPPCPRLKPLCDALGGNDNVAVNTVQIGDKTLELTDSAKATNVDWHSLRVLGDYPFKDDYVSFAHVLTTGSAHPIPVSDGYVALVAEMPLVPSRFSHTLIDFVKISNSDNGHVRKLLAQMQADVGWYAHSFGVTENHVVFPLNVKMAIDVKTMTHRSDMKDQFVGDWVGIAVLDLYGGFQKPKIYQVEPFWHTHISNTYEQLDGSIVVDVVTFSGNMFNGPMVVLKDLFNKTVRDANPNRGILKRFILNKDGTSSTAVLSHPNRQFDFVRINPQFQSKPYCFVYGSEYWHDDESVYAIAVGKLNLCSDSKPSTYWYRENWYPSEAIFVNRDGATTEDDGYLMFAALNGKTQNSHFIILNAKDMVEISNTEFQGRVAFTIHAEFLKNPYLPKITV